MSNVCQAEVGRRGRARYFRLKEQMFKAQKQEHREGMRRGLSRVHRRNGGR